MEVWVTHSTLLEGFPFFAGIRKHISSKMQTTYWFCTQGRGEQEMEKRKIESLDNFPQGQMQLIVFIKNKRLR